eukprot:974776-Prymnesium_polylepis.1
MQPSSSTLGGLSPPPPSASRAHHWKKVRAKMRAAQSAHSVFQQTTYGTPAARSARPSDSDLQPLRKTSSSAPPLPSE